MSTTKSDTQNATTLTLSPRKSTSGENIVVEARNGFKQAKLKRQRKREKGKRPLLEERNELNNTTTFKHSPLPQGRWFRLLKLLPGFDQDIVQCELITTAFDNSPPYEAISYAWGDKNTLETIICDGQPLAITLSLAQGLRRFRQTQKPRILWADGICIDQVNEEEKGHQVAFMKNIYEQGSGTLI
jgi:Heterokaryon incompatibility protein (HET)